jgi:hypothetical protein
LELLALAHKEFELEHFATALKHLESIDVLERDDLVTLIIGIIKCFKLNMQQDVHHDYQQFISQSYQNVRLFHLAFI